MEANDKQHFIENWEEYANGLSGLYNTARSLETMQEIQEIVEKVRELISKVADEGYDKDANLQGVDA